MSSIALNRVSCKTESNYLLLWNFSKFKRHRNEFDCMFPPVTRFPYIKIKTLEVVIRI